MCTSACELLEISKSMCETTNISIYSLTTLLDVLYNSINHSLLVSIYENLFSLKILKGQRFKGLNQVIRCGTMIWTQVY